MQVTAVNQEYTVSTGNKVFTSKCFVRHNSETKYTSLEEATSDYSGKIYVGNDSSQGKHLISRTKIKQ